jgi:hypothetical protein
VRHEARTTKSHLEIHSAPDHAAIANLEGLRSPGPGAHLGDGEGQSGVRPHGRAMSREQDQRCEHGDAHIIETRKGELRSRVRQLEQRSDHAVVFTEITETTMARGALLWLLGVPIPIIILLLLFWR